MYMDEMLILSNPSIVVYYIWNSLSKKGISFDELFSSLIREQCELLQIFPGTRTSSELASNCLWNMIMLKRTALCSRSGDSMCLLPIVLNFHDIAQRHSDNFVKSLRGGSHLQRCAIVLILQSFGACFHHPLLYVLQYMKYIEIYRYIVVVSWDSHFVFSCFLLLLLSLDMLVENSSKFRV